MTPEPDDPTPAPIRTPHGFAPDEAPDESLTLSDVVSLLAEELSRTLLLVADHQRRIADLERRAND